ncbi:hypothetical protein K443DRAFT_685531 [Laccaria amethystina LaAM-08-1]|jgi:hypothetical protein|uniref:Uncharacterized protein n=1 Tax=Laccaria amethystina LaAM-08-1 TaxID=1095629 RepID=A0A0C9X2W7_9AGAR|nr:hypothetical protein K443DRAFT_685531 [Laccaria amethystina LaAM-08-1]
MVISEKGGWKESGGKTSNVIRAQSKFTIMRNSVGTEGIEKNDFSKLPRKGDINYIHGS